jgi:hypothetical protein
MFLPTKLIHKELIHRGYEIASTSPTKGLIFNPTDTEHDLIETLYLSMREESFRKTLRQILGSASESNIRKIQRKKLEPTARSSLEKHLEILKSLRCVIINNEEVICQVKADNLGPTLEWYVSELVERRLHGSAEWGVHLRGLPSEASGGDYDVLAILGSKLLYIETKSSPPHNIKEGEIRQFLQRSVELAPELGILLIDTEKPLDKLLWKITEIIISSQTDSWRRDRGPGWKAEKPFICSQADLGFETINYGHKNIFVINSKPNILEQISRCLRLHHHSAIKDTIWISPPLNFVKSKDDVC